MSTALLSREIESRKDEAAADVARLQGELDVVDELIGGLLLDREVSGRFDAKEAQRLTTEKARIVAELDARRSVATAAANRVKAEEAAERTATYRANVAKLEAISAARQDVEARHIAAVKAYAATAKELLILRRDHALTDADIRGYEQVHGISPGAAALNRPPCAPMRLPEALLREVAPYLPSIDQMIAEHQRRY